MEVSLTFKATDNSDLATLATLLQSITLATPATPSTSALVMPPPAAAGTDPFANAAPPASIPTFIPPPNPPAAPPAPEAPELPADANAPNFDEFGVAFNADIHSSSRKIHQQGSEAGRFHKKRGGHQAAYDALYVGRARGAAPSVPAPPAVAAPPAAPAAPAAPPVAAVPAAPVAPVAPPAPAAPPAGAMTWEQVQTPPQVFQFASQLMQRKDRPLPPGAINEVLVQFSMKGMTDIAQRAMTEPTLPNTFAYNLHLRDQQFQTTGA